MHLAQVAAVQQEAPATAYMLPGVAAATLQGHGSSELPQSPMILAHGDCFAVFLFYGGMISQKNVVSTIMQVSTLDYDSLGRLRMTGHHC